MDAAPELAGADRGRCVAVVPVKALQHAKGRLEHDLAATDRQALTGWMLARVVTACCDARAVDEVVVVAGDDEAAGMARELGVEVVVERRPSLSAALATADTLVGAADASLVVTADLPLLTADHLDEVVRAAGSGPVVAVAESIDGGTSVLLRRPATVTSTSFGPDSASAHLELARAAGVRGVRLRVPAVALDVDDLDGLRTAAARLPDLDRWLRARGLGPQAAAS